MQSLIRFKKTILLFLVSLALAWLAAAPTAPAQALINISTRSFVLNGDNIMIAGFIIQGPLSNTVLIRALGPTLGQPPFNVPNILSDPTLELHDGNGVLIARNDDWQNTVIFGLITTNQVQAIMNSGLAPAFNLESAMIVTLTPGNYTAIVRGFSTNIIGNALVEVYD
jgi:hypothetical protein